MPISINAPLSVETQVRPATHRVDVQCGLRCPLRRRSGRQCPLAGSARSSAQSCEVGVTLALTSTLPTAAPSMTHLHQIRPDAAIHRSRARTTSESPGALKRSAALQKDVAAPCTGVDAIECRRAAARRCQRHPGVAWVQRCAVDRTESTYRLRSAPLTVPSFAGYHVDARTSASSHAVK